VRIYSSRIGHLCWNYDNYLSLIGAIETPVFSVILLDKKIANKEIFRLLRRKTYGIYLRNYIFRFTFDIIAKDIRFAKFIVSFESIHNPSFNPHTQYLNINIKSKAFNIFNKKFQMQGKPFIALHSRDDRYLGQMGGDGNAHEYRDFDFRDFTETILKLNDRYLFARLGLFEDISLPNLVQSDTYESDIWDVYLVKYAEFFVSGNSGVSQISTLLRKPHLYINYTPIRLDHFNSFPSHSLFVPKVIVKIGTGEELNLKQSLELCSNWNIHYKGKFFQDKGYKVINNSPSLIRMAVEEMIKLKEKQFELSKSEEKTKIRLEEILNNFTEHDHSENIKNFRISESFLELFPHWLD
jgi:putative glycosyltransferase (TIGR04372 family)